MENSVPIYIHLIALEGGVRLLHPLQVIDAYSSQLVDC